MFKFTYKRFLQKKFKKLRKSEFEILLQKIDEEITVSYLKEEIGRNILTQNKHVIMACQGVQSKKNNIIGINPKLLYKKWNIK